jgi:hypothetical protein
LVHLLDEFRFRIRTVEIRLRLRFKPALKLVSERAKSLAGIVDPPL